MKKKKSRFNIRLLRDLPRTWYIVLGVVLTLSVIGAGAYYANQRIADANKRIKDLEQQKSAASIGASEVQDSGSQAGKNQNNEDSSPSISSGSSNSTVVTPISPQIISFVSSPNIPYKQDNFTVSWRSKNAVRAVLSDVGEVSVNGSHSFNLSNLSYLTTSKSYTLTLYSKTNNVYYAHLKVTLKDRRCEDCDYYVPDAHTWVRGCYLECGCIKACYIGDGPIGY